MANLQVRDIDDRLYSALKNRAKARHRSLSQEVVHIIEEYLSRPAMDPKRQSELFLELSNAWTGPETAEEIIGMIRKSRRESTRFRKDHELFD